MKKDYTVLLIQLDGNLASDVSTRCSGAPIPYMPIPYMHTFKVFAATIIPYMTCTHGVRVHHDTNYIEQVMHWESNLHCS